MPWPVVVLFLLGIAVYVYMQSDSYNLKCIIASKDGQTYCVRDRPKLEKAANLLAAVVEKCQQLVKYVGKKFPQDRRAKQLVERFNPKRISETLPTSTHTAYSENKGEKIAFCLAKHSPQKKDMQLIDLNTLTFVAIHELTHVMTEDTGHNMVFWENFKWLLQCAVDCGVYAPVDYKQTPASYCGMDITDNPMFDL